MKQPATNHLVMEASSEQPLFFCYQILGTPTEKTWPGISKNQDFVAEGFPVYEAEPLSLHAPRWVGSCDVIKHDLKLYLSDHFTALSLQGW